MINIGTARKTGRINGYAPAVRQINLYGHKNTEPAPPWRLMAYARPSKSTLSADTSAEIMPFFWQQSKAWAALA